MLPWIIGGVLLLIAAAIRIVVIRRSANHRNLFLQTRPTPALSAETGPGASRVRPDVRPLGPAQSPGAPSRSHSPLQAPAFAATALPRIGVFSAAGRMPAMLHAGHSGADSGQRTTTQRPLFADLRGLTDRDNYGLDTPLPESLPIPEGDFVFGSVTPAIAQMLPESAARREVQRKNLNGAGFRSRAAWTNLTAIRFVLAFLSLVAIGVLLLAAPPAFEPWLLAMVIIVPLLMWAVPPLSVAVRAGERRIDIERGLPDVLDMMNMGISQGLTVPQSIGRISDEIAVAHPALAEELKIVCRQASVGTLSRALKGFAERIDSPDVNSFTSLLIQSESTGSSISRALSDYSDSIRSSLRQRADARANAASFKLLFPVALCLMPSVFLFLLGPAIVEMSDFFGNRAAALNADRENALDSLQQQPRIDLTQFRQNDF